MMTAMSEAKTEVSGVTRDSKSTTESHQVPGNFHLQPRNTPTPALGSSGVCGSHVRVFFVSGLVSETWSNGMLC